MRNLAQEVGSMPFEIVRNDITKMVVDAIVNTANPRPVIGSGTDSMIHEKAGPGCWKLASRSVILHVAMQLLHRHLIYRQNM